MLEALEAHAASERVLRQKLDKKETPPKKPATRAAKAKAAPKSKAPAKKPTVTKTKAKASPKSKTSPRPGVRDGSLPSFRATVAHARVRGRPRAPSATAHPAPQASPRQLHEPIFMLR